LSHLKAALTIVLLGLIGSLCLPTAGDAAVTVASGMPDASRQSAVVEQRLVVMEVTEAAGSPSIAETQATALATSYLATSSQATSIHARYVRLTLRGDNGGVAWGIQARPVWLVTFEGIPYPSATGSSDCSCSAYYWRPSTAVALDAGTGARVMSLGVTS
jgi:hypothetical protein